MTFDKLAALEMLKLNEAAYVLANRGTCTLPDGFSAPEPIRMAPGNRPFFLRGDPLDIWGFATVRDGKTYVVFRGTQLTSGIDFAQEWAEDALSLPLRQMRQGRVHLGFYGAWMALRCATPKPDIVIGHSLGAAIATLCWADLGGQLLTFACPRVGDPAFAKSLWDGQTIRIINAPDIVPRIPTDPPFRHGGQEVTVHGPGSEPFHAKTAHALASYAIGLTSLI